MTFLDHLQELKDRATKILIVFILASIAGYFIRTPLIKFLLLSRTQPLFYSSPAGGLDFIIKICLLFGCLVSLPVLLYHVLKFLEPLLPHSTHLLIFQLLLISLLLMGGGMVFAYFVSLPAALHFLGSFGADQIHSLISANEYLTFVSVYLIGFGILFQLPLVMLLINKIHPLSSKQLFAFEKYIILASFLIAAILTPTPDFINQTIMAVPIILLYQITFLLIWIVNRPILEITHA